MKKLLTLLFLACGTFAFAQTDTAWSANKSDVMGNKAENAYEQTLKTKSGNQYLARLVGFKRIYGDNLLSFIQTKLNYTLKFNPPKNAANNIYLFTSTEVYKGKRPPKRLTLTFVVDDKTNRIVSAAIDGSFDDLSNLFMNYWPKDPTFSGEIPVSQGVVAVKHSFGDLVSFSWNGANPSIAVAKDPKSKFPNPTLAASK